MKKILAKHFSLLFLICNALIGFQLKAQEKEFVIDITSKLEEKMEKNNEKLMGNLNNENKLESTQHKDDHIKKYKNYRDSGRGYNRWSGTVPLFIYEKMLEYGCEPIRDFYEDSFNESAPFVNDYQQGFAFLCESVDMETGFISYKFVQRHNDFVACASEIFLQNKADNFHFENGKRLLHLGDEILNPAYLPSESVEVLELDNSLILGNENIFTEYFCIDGNWHYTFIDPDGDSFEITSEGDREY